MIYVLIEEYGIVLAVAALAVVAYYCLIGFYKRRKENVSIRTLQSAVDQLKNTEKAKEKIAGVEISDLVNSYIKMVAKYGVGSDEAKAVLFGLTNPTVQTLYGEFLEEFNHRVEVVNKTWMEMRK